MSKPASSIDAATKKCKMKKGHQIQPSTSRSSRSYLVKSTEDLVSLTEETTKMLQELCAPLKFGDDEKVTININCNYKFVKKEEKRKEGGCGKSVFPLPAAISSTNTEFWETSDVVLVDKILQLKSVENVIYIRKLNTNGMLPSKFYFAKENLAFFIERLHHQFSTIQLRMENGTTTLALGGISMDEQSDTEQFWANPNTITIGNLHIRPFVSNIGLCWKMWQKLDQALLVMGKWWDGSKTLLSYDQMRLLVRTLENLLE